MFNLSGRQGQLNELGRVKPVALVQELALPCNRCLCCTGEAT